MKVSKVTSSALSSLRPERKKKLLKLLAETYPDAKSELNFSSNYELLVSVLLSAQCTDKKVNEITPALFSRFRDFKALSEGSEDEVEVLIRQVNYYRTKAKHLVKTAKIVQELFGGEIPRTHKELTTLPGVGRKTANVVLTEMGVEPAIGVDTHVFRVAKRLGLSEGKTPLAVEEDLMKGFSKDAWRLLHHTLVLHGRRVCKAQRPLCPQCSLLSVCPTGQRASVKGQPLL